jgi:hypothetical protein
LTLKASVSSLFYKEDIQTTPTLKAYSKIKAIKKITRRVEKSSMLFVSLIRYFNNLFVSLLLVSLQKRRT